MQRQLPKQLLDKAKSSLSKDFKSRIIKNDNGCWYLKSKQNQNFVDFLCYYYEKGSKKIFFN